MTTASAIAIPSPAQRLWFYLRDDLLRDSLYGENFPEQSIPPYIYDGVTERDRDRLYQHARIYRGVAQS